MTKQSSAFSSKKFMHLLSIYCLVHDFEVPVSQNASASHYNSKLDFRTISKIMNAQVYVTSSTNT